MAQQPLKEGFIKLSGKDYKLAAQRVKDFRTQFPITSGWGLVSKLIEGGQDAKYATVEASVINPEGKVIATDRKTETETDFKAGWVEKATTGAFARALALCGFGTLEVDIEGETKRPADAPVELQQAIQTVSNIDIKNPLKQLNEHPFIKDLQPVQKLSLFKQILSTFSGKPDECTQVYSELDRRYDRQKGFNALLDNFEGTFEDRKELLETLLGTEFFLEQGLGVADWDKIKKEYIENDVFKQEEN